MPKRIAITAVLLAALLVSLAASRVTSQPSEPSAALKAEAEARGTVRVIVHLDTPFVPEDQLPTPAHIQVQRQEIARVRALVQASLRGTQHRVIREYDALPFLSLEVGPDALRILMSLQGVVVDVQKDDLAAPMLAESVPLIQGDQAWALGYDGTGQIVAILDTGVDKNHAFLAGKVVGEACFSTTDAGAGATSVCPGGAPSSTAPGSALPCGVSGCDHGTNVAGIAAGGTGASGSGVAKGAKILAIQVFSSLNTVQECGSPPCAKSFTSDQLAALNYVYTVRNSFPGLSVASVNMSAAGSTLFSSQCDGDSRKAAIDQLRGAGIPTTLPAGNAGSPNSLSAPACISTAVSVGATLDGTINPIATPVDTVAGFSNTAPFLSLLAPGQWINSSAPGGGFTNFAGTSQASGHVAGAFAVLRHASPNASVDTLLQALQNTGLPISDARANPPIVKSRIRVRDAIAAILPQGPALNAVPASGPPGSGLTVTLTNWGGGSADWLAMAVVGSANTSYVTYVYANTLPGTGGTKTWTTTMPGTLGQYEVRLFPNNGYVLAAKSNTITVANINPTPAISGLTPTAVAAGSAGFPLTVNGTGFVNGATATVGGNARTVTFGSSTQLTVGVLAGDVTTIGSVNIVVTNPGACANSVCVSNAVALQVTAPPAAPVLTAINPTTTGAGGANFTLTATGQNFAANSVVQVGGSARATIYDSPGQLRATILAGDIGSSGNLSITVFTPAPGGGTSGAQTLTVTPPVGPALNAVPASGPPGSGLTVTLTNWGGGSFDWLALASVGSPNTSYLTYVYVGGLPGTGGTKTWTTTMPATLGQYEVRLLLNNGYVRAATSNTITVTPP